MADVIKKMIHTTEEVDAHIDSKALHLKDGERESVSKVEPHLSDAVSHITATERSKWNGAAEQSLINLTSAGMQRKNLLRNEAVTKTVNGVTFTVNADGSVTASGTATANAQLVIFDGQPSAEMVGKELHLSGCPEGGSSSTYRMIIQNTTSGFATLCIDSGNGADFTITADITSIRCIFTVYQGQTVENITLYPMLRYSGITDNSYEQYRPSLQEQINALTAQLAAINEGGNA